MNILHLIILIVVAAVLVRLIVEIKRLNNLFDEGTERELEMNDMLLQSMRQTDQLQADYDRLRAKLEPYQTKEWQNPNPWKDGAE
jgi:predicted Holliday junction resolvase-like endonuclease